jgi:hypothetical protein
MGPFIVTLAGLDDPLYLPVPVPVQDANTYRSPVTVEGGEAVMETIAPASCHDPVGGSTVPGLDVIVSWYWWVQDAVSVMAPLGFIVICWSVPE